MAETTGAQATTTITTTITTGGSTTVATITTTTPDPSTTTATTATTSTNTATVTKPGKITICHHVFKAKTTKHVTIKVSTKAWPAHKRHGDSIGRCSSALAKKIHSGKAHVRKWHHGRKK